LQLVEPVGVVRHDRAGAEIEKPREHLADRGDVLVDLGVGQQRAARVLAGRIADLARAAAHQGDRTMAGLLQPAQHHDGEKIADMEARRGGIEADIGRDRPRRGPGIQALGVRNLMDESPFCQNAQKIGPVGAHVWSSRDIACLRPVV
jgi:hypothetical protein